KVGNGHDACVVIRQLIFLVGGVQPVVGQSESHKYGGDAKVPREIAHNRNRSAAADEDGVAAEDVGEGACGDRDGGVIRIHRHGRARAQHADLRLNSSGRYLSDVFLVGVDHAFGILRGNQANADLGGGLCGDDGLRARACESAGDAVDFQGGTGPGAFEHGETGLAREPRCADFAIQKFFFVEWQNRPAVFLSGRGRLDVVVDSWNLNVSV